MGEESRRQRATLRRGIPAKAARYAGYTDDSAARYAYEIFNRPNVREAIESCLRNRTGITKPWIVDKLAPIIDTNLADIGSWDADGTFVLLPSDDLTDEQKVAVSEVVTEYGKNGRTTKVKLHDKLAAMAQLSKLLNMLVDRQEISGPGGGPVEVTDHRARITERLNDRPSEWLPTMMGHREPFKSYKAAALRGFTGIDGCSRPPVAKNQNLAL